MSRKYWESRRNNNLEDYFQEDFVKEAAAGNISINLKTPEAKKEQAKPSEGPTGGGSPQAPSAGPETGPAQIDPNMGMAPQPGMDPNMGAPAPQPGMDPNAQPMVAGQIDPMTGMPLNGPMPAMPPAQTNDVRQAGLPATGIICNSDCMYSQNMKGMCSLNKINFTQVKEGVFTCENFEPILSEPYVGAPEKTASITKGLSRMISKGTKTGGMTPHAMSVARGTRFANLPKSQMFPGAVKKAIKAPKTRMQKLREKIGL